MSSNDEVQTLREQLLLHQPMAEDNEDGSEPPTLRAELAPKEEHEPQVISQELHIHHHYRAPAKKVDVRRPKKKHISINAALFTPPNAIQSPGTPRSRQTANTILSQTSVTVPTPIAPDHRWSMQSGQMSDFAPSSVPSSPQSMYRNSALFDRGFNDHGLDSSRPTSPGSSIEPLSPTFQPYHHRKRGSDLSCRSFTAPINFQPNNVIHEEEDSDVREIQELQTPSIPSLDDDFDHSNPSKHSEYLDNSAEEWSPPAFEPKLRYSASHESTPSISGIDIHTLKSRPSQLTVTGAGALLRPRTRLGISSPSMSMISVESLTGSSMITARPILSRQGHDSTSYLRFSMGSGDTDTLKSSASSSSLSKNLGGWIFGRWGVAPATPSDDIRGTNPVSPSPHRAVSTPIIDPLKEFIGRPPGINQKGPIPGFRRTEKAPSRVMPTVVDQDALREVLME
jgi:hypothetical protein